MFWDTGTSSSRRDIPFILIPFLHQSSLPPKPRTHARKCPRLVATLFSHLVCLCHSHCASSHLLRVYTEEASTQNTHTQQPLADRPPLAHFPSSEMNLYRSMFFLFGEGAGASSVPHVPHVPHVPQHTDNRRTGNPPPPQRAEQKATHRTRNAYQSFRKSINIIPRGEQMAVRAWASCSPSGDETGC